MTTSNPHEAPNRRGFFRRLWDDGWRLGAGALGVVALIWGGAGLGFFAIRPRTVATTRFKAGYPDELAPGDVDQRFRDARGVWIARLDEDDVSRIIALSATCTHLGCLTQWDGIGRRFQCPCHGSRFHASGVNYEGPAPRPLERYAIRVAEDGRLEIDTSRVFREELGQWDAPDCFVLV